MRTLLLAALIAGVFPAGAVLAQRPPQTPPRSSQAPRPPQKPVAGQCICGPSCPCQAGQCGCGMHAKTDPSAHKSQVKKAPPAGVCSGGKCPCGCQEGWRCVCPWVKTTKDFARSAQAKKATPKASSQMRPHLPPTGHATYFQNRPTMQFMPRMMGGCGPGG